jgi:hypothetical protein
MREQEVIESLELSTSAKGCLWMSIYVAPLVILGVVAVAVLA